MQNWDDFRLILALHRHKTLRAAANELGINHATVSRRLATLNRFQGRAIFEPTASGHQATQLGLELIASAKEMEQHSEKALRQWRTSDENSGGAIRLSLPATLGNHLLLPYLSTFCQENPSLDITIHSSYAPVDLNKSEADIVVRASNSPPEQLVGRRLFPYYLGYYAAENYLQSTPEKEQLWIGSDDDSLFDQWVENSPRPGCKIGVRISDIEMRHQYASLGKGLLRGACYMADRNPRLTRLENSKIEPGHELWVLTHPDLKSLPRIKKIMRFLADTLTDNKALISGLKPRT